MTDQKVETEIQSSGTTPVSKTEDFNFEGVQGYDSAREKFEIIAIKMDIHKNGVLYLKELVFFTIFILGFVIKYLG